MFERWRRFWFPPCGPQALAACRILFYGAFFLFYLPVDFSLWGSVSRVFWMPTPLFRLLGLQPLSPEGLGLLQLFWKAALLFSCLGLATRFSTGFVFLAGFYLLGLPHCFGKTHHFDAIIVLLFGLLALSRCADVRSLDRKLRPGGSDLQQRIQAAAASGEYGWPIQGARVLLSLVLFAAGVAKLRESGLDWALSDNMNILLVQYQYHLANADPMPGWGPWLAQHLPWAVRGMGAASLAIEVGTPAALFSKAARWLLVPGAIGMLVGIRLLMGPTFLPLILCQLFWLPWDRNLS